MRAHTRRASLAQALGLSRSGVVAFVGAGGKSTAIRRLLAERPSSVATTTTHLARSGYGRGLLAVAPDSATLRRVETRLLRQAPLTLAVRGDARRLRGPDAAWHESFARLHPRQLVLVEADGAARRQLKLPAAHEPAWPAGTLRDAVIVLGCGALGEPLASAAHHPERFRALRLRSANVGVEHLAAMLRAYVHVTPPGVAIRVLLTGVHEGFEAHAIELAEHARRVVRQRDPLWNDPSVALRIVATRDDGTPWLVRRVTTPRRRHTVPLAGVCGVLLAAGLGSRFHADVASKLLMPWRGRTLVAHAVQRWCRAGFAEILVVTGHAADAVEAQVLRTAPAGARLRVVRNRIYRRGLGSSVRAAARAATPGMGLLFGHADMPAVDPEALRRLAGVGLRLRHRVVVPTHRGQPANPVFFPASFRAALQRIGDAEGGRSVYRARAKDVFELPMRDDDNLVDVDRVEDLQRL